MTYGKHRNTVAPHVGIFSRVRDATLENPMDDPPEFFCNICLCPSQLALSTNPFGFGRVVTEMPLQK